MQSYSPHRKRPKVVSASQQLHCLRPGTHWLPEHPPPPQVLHPPPPLTLAPYRLSKPPPSPQLVQLACSTSPTVAACLTAAAASRMASFNCGAAARMTGNGAGSSSKPSRTGGAV